MKPVMLTTESGKSVIAGYIEGAFTFSTKRTKNHIFRGGQPTVEMAREKGVSAIGMDLGLVKRLEAAGIKLITVKMGRIEKTIHLSAYSKGEGLEPGQRFVLTFRGHGTQVFVNERAFR